jgi:hypothetical protein
VFAGAAVFAASVLLSSPFFHEGVGWYHPIIAENGEFCIRYPTHGSFVTTLLNSAYSSPGGRSVTDIGGHPLIEATALFVASLIVDGVYGVLGQSASTAV